MPSEILPQIGAFLQKLDPPIEVDLTPENLGDITLRQLALDSLKSLEMLMHLEDTLGVESPIDQHPDDTTLNDIAEHYMALVQVSSGTGKP